jgi:hypothetical protein
MYYSCVSILNKNKLTISNESAKVEEYIQRQISEPCGRVPSGLPQKFGRAGSSVDIRFMLLPGARIILFIRASRLAMGPTEPPIQCVQRSSFPRGGGGG